MSPNREPPTTIVDQKDPLGRDAQLERIRRFAYWLDSGIGVPGTGIRIGLDPIIGLVPGLGDAAGAVLAGWIMLEAARRGVSRATLARIGYNITVDALIGAVPLIGDLVDFAWKANLRNVALLERHQTDPTGATRIDRSFVVLLTGAVVVVCAGLAVGTGFLVAALIRAVFAR